MTKIRLGLLLAAVAAVSWASCAYYNIFWMAESEYEKALEREQYGFWDPYRQIKLQGESERLVDSSLERFGKLLLLYPNSRWADDALLLMGNCFLLKGEHQNALRKYDEILQLYESSDFAPMARYMKAYTLIRDGSVQQAITLLEGLAEDTEHRDIRQRAVFLLGRVVFERGECGRAVEFFEAYLADFRKGPRVAGVRLSLASCLLEMGEADRAVDVLEPLSKKPTEEGYQAAIRLGKARRAMGENDEAVEIFRRLTEEASEDSVKARATLEIARTMVAREEAEEAVTVFDEAAEIATTKLGDLRDEIIYTQGLVYEKDLGNFDNAIEAYEKIANSRSEFGSEARRRSEALKAVGRFKGALTDTVPKTANEEAFNRFMLGETYLMDLGLTDEAFMEFKTVADSFADTEVAPRAMLRTATMLEAQGDTLARVYLGRVIELFPGTVHANFARSRMGLPLVDVEITKPVVWDTGRVVGPPSAGAAEDSLPVGGSEIPGPPLPAETASDTLDAGRRRPPRAEDPGRISPLRSRRDFTRADSAHADSAGGSAPDTTEKVEGYRP